MKYLFILLIVASCVLAINLESYTTLHESSDYSPQISLGGYNAL
jgi:hypothetical protein